MLIKIGSALIDPEAIVVIKPYPDEYLKIEIILNNGTSFLTDASMDETEAALTVAGVVNALTPDPDDAPVPDMDEDEIDRIVELKSDGYEYLARDKDGKLWAYRVEPEDDGSYWSSEIGGARQVFEGFDFITKNDKKPTEINSLLRTVS